MNIFVNGLGSSLSKRLLISLLTVGMSAHLAGCAMGGSSDEEAAASGSETFAEESSGDFADGEAPPEGGAAADGAVADAGAMPEGDDLGAEVADAGKESGGDAAGADDLALEGDDLGSGDLAAGGGAQDELSLDDELPTDVASNNAPPPIIDEPPAPAPTDAPVFADAPTEAPTDTVAAAPTEPTAWVPLKKMKTAAFTSGKANLNRVYLARHGDTKKGIAEKLYGDKSRAKDLSKWNGFLARGVKTGDKIYYTSPTNPTDTNMMTYYEDVGVPAQNYVTRDGDNLRTVAKTLLGDKESWKEVWATNADVDSKGDVAAGLNIRYWPEGSQPTAPVMANNGTPPQDPMGGGTDPLAQQPPPTGGNADPLAVPPADPLAANPPGGMAPNDPVAQQRAANDPLSAPTGTPASESPPVVVGQTEVPPPPPPAAPAAPAPVEKAAKHAPEPAAAANTEEADNMMMMGLGGIVLLAAGAVFFLMRSRRSRKGDLTQTTQIG